MSVTKSGIGDCHSVVCDGYNSITGEYHINFGWGGGAIGWYSLPTGLPDGYNVVKDAVLEIIPLTPTPSPTPQNPTPTLPPQPVPFREDFEAAWRGGAPYRWSREYISGNQDWERSVRAPNGYPQCAQSMAFFALLYTTSGTANVTRLITPPLSFGSSADDPRLSYWTYMINWSNLIKFRVYYRTTAEGSWTLLTEYTPALSPYWKETRISLPDPGDAYYLCFEGETESSVGICIDNVLVAGGPTPVTTPTPVPQPPSTAPWIYDYNGDGTSDLAVFRPSAGLWAVRGVTRVYFGGSSDDTVPGDYDGNGTTDIGIFRPAAGLWAVRGVTRSYFGSASDLPVPGDYSGDGNCDIGVFRESAGLWAIRGVTRAYFGASGDTPVPGYYAGSGRKDIGLFRGSAGLWAIRGVTRAYFGGGADDVVPGDYNGDESWEIGIFRPAAGLWAIRGVTRSYFGSSSDYPVPADYSGNSFDDIGIFRPVSGLWAVRGVTRVYFGTAGDIPVTR